MFVSAPEVEEILILEAISAKSLLFIKIGTHVLSVIILF